MVLFFDFFRLVSRNDLLDGTDAATTEAVG